MCIKGSDYIYRVAHLSDCPAGTYFSGDADWNDVCTPCAKGSYSVGWTVTCSPCPDGETTDKVGATSVDKCHPEPKEGQYLDAITFYWVSMKNHHYTFCESYHAFVDYKNHVQ